MDYPVTHKLSQALSDRRAADTFRALHRFDGVDFCSNDYLGLAGCHLDIGEQKYGATGSRLISGHNRDLNSLETHIAKFHGFESALLFGSGYAANSGLLACLGGADDLYLTDELIHASAIDGVRLSYAQRDRFKHNDVTDLREKLSQYSKTIKGQIFVVVEGLYSMDGDHAPLKDIADLCRSYKAALIVDEAHSGGIYGAQGQGLIFELGLHDDVFAVIYTFGKAFGLHGAVICGSNLLRDYLINFCRPLIYSTAPSPHICAATQAAYQRLEQAEGARRALGEITTYFQKRVKSMRLPNTVYWLPSQSPIQALITPGNARAKALATHLQDQAYGVKAILSPTVQDGQERLRISIHSFNTKVEIDGLLQATEDFFARGAP